MSEIKIEYRDNMKLPDVAAFLKLARETVNTSREIEDKHVAYVAIVDGEIRGATFFTELQGASEWWIDISFVTEEYRRKGIHSKLFSVLKGHAESVGIKRIQCEVVNTNSVSKAAMEAQGRKAFSTIYRYDIPQEVEHGQEE